MEGSDSVTFSQMKGDPVLVDYCSMLLPRDCCHDFLVDFNFQERCLKIALSKGLGYSIIVASLIVKLPQLLKIFGAKSGAGLSVLGITLELLAVTFNAAYSYGKRYPFSAWGEASFLIVETAAIAVLVIWFDGKRLQALLFAVLYTAGLVTLLSGKVGIDILWKLQAANLPLAVIGKLIQAQKNYSNGHTGQLSAFTVCLLCGGCVARVFTSIQETGDSVIVATFAAAAVANGLLVAQVFFYWNKTNLFLKKESKKKRK